MNVDKRVVALLRTALIALFVVMVVLQTLSFPGQFAHMAAESPDMAYLRWPATALTAFLIVCVEVVIVCIWRLLTLVRGDRIFTTASLIWVDVILWSILAGWLAFAAAFLYVGLHADDPGLPLLMFVCLTAAGVIGLLMVVMRALLRQATALRADMDTVI
ncbi:DUF2975 domain-containing protein [Gordonia sp. SID5947]|uniref:DUF2975 domain-containing protein n=1 Tax=Gordonia sp. SID5947 TaxID=2690315 RepID=UPI00136A4A64|nr:DUF2975 domain-containing protein [Gordonia sp. SID5947]MYR08481.1 DUF2975 domain-containing protein [Gordonia sp. SID5947]